MLNHFFELSLFVLFLGNRIGVRLSKFVRFIKLGHVSRKSSRAFEPAYKLRCTKKNVKEVVLSYYRKLLFFFFRTLISVLFLLFKGSLRVSIFI